MPISKWILDDVGELIGLSETDEMLASVKTGGSRWRFFFPKHEGNGEIKIGAGCDYNPLLLIEKMYDMLENDEVEIPSEFIEIDADEEDYDSVFVGRWE
jgi:hypothetical protein